MNRTRTLAILLFDDVEVLDFCGPFEVFSAANRFTDPPAFNVLTVAERAGPVVTRGGLGVLAGIAAGIDMSLHVVGRLLGKEVAEKTARQMEYPFGATP
jgi:transcriptional regulator GlxA family with amidase domain